MKILSSFVLVIAFIFLTPLKLVLASSPAKNLIGDKPLLIVEVQIAVAGKKSFVKIYNSSNKDLNIAGYKLRKRSSTGGESPIRVFPQGSKVLAKSYFLWANSKDDYHLKIGANIRSGATLAKNNNIALLNPENKILDGLAWGKSQNPFVEGLPFSENPSTNQKLERKQINGIYQDTNNNINDFYLNPPSEPKIEAPFQKSQPESFLIPGPENIIPAQTSAEVKSLQIIDINTASAEELQKIVGIGPVLAQRIIDARPFYSLDGLAKVSGIGKKTLAEIKKQGLAWVNPELKPPKIEKTESSEKGLAAISESLQQIQSKQILKSLFIFLIALPIAIFSGIIILILKKKLKKDYNKNI